MKKRLLVMVTGMALIFSMALAASAAWSSDTVLDVPGWNGNATSSVSAAKSRSDSQCTFQTYENQAWGLYGVDGRLLNSDGVARSSWARDMHTGTTLHAATTAVSGHYYWAQLSTDLLEPNTISVSFRFSPDNE
ncbi:MAG: hypothetical protein RR502_01140 [Oscillospiraceae bacterium]